jgi:hypothetical protein
VQRDWAMMTPLACSVTGMVSSRASNRAYSDCRSRSRPSREGRRPPGVRDDSLDSLSLGQHPLGLLPQLHATGPVRYHLCSGIRQAVARLTIGNGGART